MVEFVLKSTLRVVAMAGVFAGMLTAGVFAIEYLGL
jgi:hypothetical protein